MKDQILQGDALEMLKTLPDESVHCIITSPPYFGLRDYGMDGQIGLEETPEDFVLALVEVFREAKRVLRDDGTLWLNLGDSYSGSGKGQTREGLQDPKRGKTNGMKLKNSSKGFDGIKPKDLIGIPWRVAFALQADGWYLRQDIIWHKPNPMPESVTDRCTKAHEYVFLLSKSPTYHFDNEAIKQPPAESTVGRGPVDFGGAKGRDYKPEKGDPNYRGGNEQWGRTYHYTEGKVNKRSVWTVTTKPFSEAHFATFPEKLIEPMILAGCPEGGTVLDPFFGAGTTGVVAKKNGRNYIGIELNPVYIEIAERRLLGTPQPLFV